MKIKELLVLEFGKRRSENEEALEMGLKLDSSVKEISTVKEISFFSLILLRTRK